MKAAVDAIKFTVDKNLVQKCEEVLEENDENDFEIQNQVKENVEVLNGICEKKDNLPVIEPCSSSSTFQIRYKKPLDHLPTKKPKLQTISVV